MEENSTADGEQYVAIDELECDIVFMGVYDEYEEAEEIVKAEIRDEFLTVDEPESEVYERFGSKNGVTVYFVDDARVSNYQIHKVSN